KESARRRQTGFLMAPGAADASPTPSRFRFRLFPHRMTAPTREDHGMERFIADLVKSFESGKIDRRQFCETVALATTVFAAGSAAQAAPARGLKMLGVNHISYACADYRVARDWYAKVFNTKIYNDKGMGRANLAFGGPEPGKGGAFIITRNFGANEKPAGAV